MRQLSASSDEGQLLPAVDIAARGGPCARRDSTPAVLRVPWARNATALIDNPLQPNKQGARVSPGIPKMGPELV